MIDFWFDGYRNEADWMINGERKILERLAEDLYCKMCVNTVLLFTTAYYVDTDTYNLVGTEIKAISHINEQNKSIFEIIWAI